MKTLEELKQELGGAEAAWEAADAAWEAADDAYDAAREALFAAQNAYNKKLKEAEDEDT